MKKNYFVDAHIKTKKLENFWEEYLIKSKLHTPYISEGKLKFKEKGFEPTCWVRRHIFIK
jgi:hypothetical protein